MAEKGKKSVPKGTGRKTHAKTTSRRTPTSAGEPRSTRGAAGSSAAASFGLTMPGGDARIVRARSTSSTRTASAPKQGIGLGSSPAHASAPAMISPIASCSVRKPSWPDDRVHDLDALVARDEVGELVLEPQRIETIGRDTRDRHLGRHARRARRPHRRGRGRRRGGSSPATTRCRCWRRSGARASRRGTRGTTRPCTSPPSNGCSSFWWPRLNRCSSSSSERY